MGLFSALTDPPPPQVIRRFGEGSEGPYGPGSQVVGDIVLQTPVQRTLRHARISFYGRTYTHLTRKKNTTGANGTSSTSTTHYHHETTVFEVSMLACENTVLQPGKPHSWPFKCSFPDSPMNDGSNMAQSESLGIGAQVKAHDAHPPSLDWTKSRNHYARIEYRIDAIFTFADSSKPHTVQFTPLQFMPLPPPPAYCLQLHRFRRGPECYASSRLLGKELSLRQSIRETFTSRDVPSLLLDMTADFPSTFSAGSRFTINTCLWLSNFTSDQITIPKIFIRINLLELRHITKFRAMRHGVLSASTVESTDESPIPLSPMSAMSWWVDQQWDDKHDGPIYPMSVNVMLPPSVTPTFTAIDISRRYRFKFHVVATICGKEFDWKVSVPDIEVLAPCLP